MAKWLCSCGHEMRSSGDIPNETEYLMISDRDFDAFSGTVQAEDVYTNMTHAFRCPACGRLHVFWTGWDDNPTVYAAE